MFLILLMQTALLNLLSTLFEVLSPSGKLLFYVLFWCLQRLEEGTSSLELELQMVVSHHVGAGDGTWVLRKGTKCCPLQSHLISLERSSKPALQMHL